MNIDQIRKDTPACENIIHFDNAGASLMPQPVFQAMIDHLELERDVGGYGAARLADADLKALYSELAGLLNTQPDEIAFVENATRAWDMAFYGLPLKEGDRILTHASEYASNYMAFLQQAKRRGLFVDLVPSDASGQIDVVALENMVTPRTRLIAITHIPTQGGLVNPVEAVGEVARKHGLYYLLDACQSAGQLQLDVQKIGCQMLSGTGRKFLRGPRGTGFLYVSNDIVEELDPPFVDLLSGNWTGADGYTLQPGALRFENWESNVAGRVGLAAAVRYARKIGLDAIGARVTDLGASLRAELARVPGVEVHDLGAQKCGIVTFRREGETPQALAERLRAAKINVSVAGAGSAMLDLPERGLDAVVRASVHYFNTDTEIARFCEAVEA